MLCTTKINDDGIPRRKHNPWFKQDCLKAKNLCKITVKACIRDRSNENLNNYILYKKQFSNKRFQIQI